MPASPVRNALRTLISLTPGLGGRELNGELERLGVPIASVPDLQAIGGYIEPVTGVWALPAEARAFATEIRLERGRRLEALSHRFRELGPARWQAERNRLIHRWIREDQRARAAA